MISCSSCCCPPSFFIVLVEEKLSENSEKLGKILRKELRNIDSDLVDTVRGKGLLDALVIKPRGKVDGTFLIFCLIPLTLSVDFNSPFLLLAKSVCYKLKENGLLAKPTHHETIRFAPPLVMTEPQMYECIDIIRKTLKSM